MRPLAYQDCDDNVTDRRAPSLPLPGRTVAVLRSDDANPHARWALCSLLERLGGDGAGAWMKGVGVKAIEDEIVRRRG